MSLKKGIVAKLKKVYIELFGDIASFNEKSNLIDDLGLDSIDLLDFEALLEKEFNIKHINLQGCLILTDVIDIIEALLNNREEK